MALFDSFYLCFMRKRLREIDGFAVNAEEVQQNQLSNLLTQSIHTEYGKKYGFEHIRSAEQFRQNVPVVSYQELKPYVERLMAGENKLLWNDEIKFFSKSSGTTGSQSKYIPVSRQALKDCHYKGGRDMLALYMRENPKSGLFAGKNISMGGSLHSWKDNPDICCGDVSAIITSQLPCWAEIFRTPKRKIALMEEWESKLQQMAQATLHQNIRSLLGVPSWSMLLLEKVLELSKKDSLHEVWPNFEVFIHGGVSFVPYAQPIKKLLGEDCRFWETYNASEGFFGIQYGNGSDMLLMLDYGVYYEFMPMKEIGKPHPKTLGIGEVETGKQYALVISTNAGLWRYLIGDTVVFTSTKPYLFKVNGRTTHFINTFGEELIVDNADHALAAACAETKAEINEYTVAPVFLDADNCAHHQWLVEFKQHPANIAAFADILDHKLKELNSDYDAKRYNNMILKMPEIVSLPEGTFYSWLKSKGKLGGQHKVPRLSNDRQYADEILNFAHRKA
ncbi:MAG: GH3 auxin-responsive promoter family protein [Lentimicrobiaceae bacterium]|nr:GH3 auxin-responsive promoter family protein [Lentimicrobiaceae bacterium]